MSVRIITLSCYFLFSVSAAAQIVKTNEVLKQTDILRDRIDSINNDVRSREFQPPFSLSSLPPIESVVTEPLSTLPEKLPVGTNLPTALFVEVEVENGWRAVQHQWILLANQKIKQRLVSLGATIDSESTLNGLGLSLVRFTVPQALDSRQALAKHLGASALQNLDRNHIYQAQSRSAVTADKLSRANDVGSIDPSTTSDANQRSMCDESVNIGMIDSAINRKHPAFLHKNILAKSFLPEQLQSPTQHGSAVASLLVGQTQALYPLLSNATLYSAEVFYAQSEYSQGATLSAMITALDWMIRQRVKVVNMSLAGPDNQILASAIAAAANNGVFIVAAAGNEGPAAPAVYPAGYKEVIAVSAVDEKMSPYRWSNQGEYVDFSAHGVNVFTAQGKDQLGRESGTSMAAPVVTAALACILVNAPQDNAQDQVLSSLVQRAVDLGPAGRDPIFGYGVIKRH